MIYLTFGCKIDSTLIPDHIKISESHCRRLELCTGIHRPVNSTIRDFLTVLPVRIDPYKYIVDTNDELTYGHEHKGPKPMFGWMLDLKGIYPHSEANFMKKTIKMVHKELDVMLTDNDFGYIYLGQYHWKEEK